MDFLKDWVVWIFSWIRDACFEFISVGLSLVFDAFPEIDYVNLIVLTRWYSMIDGWLPLSEFLVLWSLHVTFMAALISLRWFIKFTPFIGG